MTPRDRTIRFTALRDMGCLIAHIRGIGYVPCEIHHLLTTGLHGNGKRRGDEATIALNPYSHRGIRFDGWTLAECRRMFGPSYALEPVAFRATFGTDDDLLALENARIAAWHGSIVGRVA